MPGICPKSLIDTRVRIAMRRNFREMPVDIMRGTVTDMNTAGITISGRHFQEVLNAVSGDFEQRPLSKQNKIFFIPFGSVKFIEVVLPDTKTAEVADRVERRSVLETPFKEYIYAPRQKKATKDEEE